MAKLTETEQYEPIKLLKLKSIIDTAVKRAGKQAKHARVEFFVKENCYRITNVWQGNIFVDVNVELKRVKL